MNLWKKVVNHGIGPENPDWDNRNLRFMNALAFIMSCSMLMFGCFVIFFRVYEDLPLLGIGFCLSAGHFLVAWKFNMTVTKIYFSIVPTLMIGMFAIFAVGNAGNDKYYIFTSTIVPLVLFRNKWSYIPLIWFNIVVFFGVEWAQRQIRPLSNLSEDELFLYHNLNYVMIFTFIYFLLQLFKNEIYDYQKKIEDQKEIIEEKNHEVTQSIEYAQKIQQAILPSVAFREMHLPNSFVLYKPKDIVAGDFYWMERSGDHLFFAAADCTGHGVPGAMVSVVCHNALNQAVHEFKLCSPAKILDKTRELVIKTFKHSDREVKDGMDISLCAYHIKDKTLQFAGANNGLYLLKKGDLIELKPHKEPIGNFQNPTPFKDQSVQIETGDTVYLYTDGFADQFGGDKGKKYKYKSFKDFLKQLQDAGIKEHEKLIGAEFERWKGDLEQVDDICIIGVRF